MGHGKQWLQSESWSDNLSWKIILTILCVVAGDFMVLHWFGVW